MVAFSPIRVPPGLFVGATQESSRFPQSYPQLLWTIRKRCGAATARTENLK
jgi:hypothetical protein